MIIYTTYLKSGRPPTHEDITGSVRRSVRKQDFNNKVEDT